MTKRERAEIVGIISDLEKVGRERCPFWFNTRYWRARATISSAHIRLSTLTGDKTV